MTRRVSIAGGLAGAGARVAGLAMLAGAAACAAAAPIAPEPLWRPTPRTIEPAPAAGAAAPAEPCRTNFFGEPSTGRRREREARAQAEAAEAALVAADRGPPSDRRDRQLDALDAGIDALRKDPYGPAPTYTLAVGYAVVGRPTCAVALLERLAALTALPAVEAEATRAIERATRDPVFEPFRADARRALGR